MNVSGKDVPFFKPYFSDFSRIDSSFLRIISDFSYRSSHCIPRRVLRKARDQKLFCLHRPLPAPGFMGLRPIPPLGLGLLL